MNNCPELLGFHSEFDCCYAPTIGDEDFCTTAIGCEVSEGDCDLHEECQEDLLCGSDNCPYSLGFDPETDCCFDNSQTVVGDESFCTNVNPCSQDEGDCDLHNECQDGLHCGSNNCPASLGFDSEVDCCFPCPGSCGFPSYVGDDYCDDENNNCGCEWDGGDCCGSDVNTDYCNDCDCLDPDAGCNFFEIIL